MHTVYSLKEREHVDLQLNCNYQIQEVASLCEENINMKDSITSTLNNLDTAHQRDVQGRRDNIQSIKKENVLLEHEISEFTKIMDSNLEKELRQ